MQVTADFLPNLILALGLGLTAALSLSLLRGWPAVRRVRVSATLTVLLYGLARVLEGVRFPNSLWAEQVTLALFSLLGANTLLQLFDWLTWDYLLGQRRHITIPRLVVDVFNFVVLTAVALAVLNRVFGVDLSALLVTSTVVSAVIGLALQDTLGNIVAGLALQIEKPFAEGDWVRVSGEEGQVVQMNWRTITLRTRDHHHVLMPNANLAREYLINYSRPSPLERRQVQIGLGYQHPPERAKTLLARAAAEAAGVAAAPAPLAQVKEFGESAVQYELHYWITDYARLTEIQDEVLTRVWYALQRAGLTVPAPAREVTLRTLSDDYAAQQEAQQRRAVLTELRRTALFAPLSDAQVEQLALSARLERYATGEFLVRQGEAGDSLFVVQAGRVRVDVRAEAGQTTTLDQLGPDDFFGEMSLLTGEPRSASVVAEAETEVVVVDKAGLARLIAEDTHVPEALSLAVGARMRNTAEQVAGLTPSDRKPAAGPSPALLGRIRKFFGMGTG